MQTATRTQKLIAVGAIAALALLSVQAYALVTTGSLATTIRTASGSTDPPSNSTISVTGNGQVTVQPDIALLSIGVNTQGSSAQAAAQQNAQTMAKVIAALENLGINSSSIQTVSYDIYQQNQYATPVVCSTPLNSTACFSSGGYEVDDEVQVTISASNQTVSQLGTQAGAAIDAAVAQGANEVYGVQFTASNTQLQQANTEALQAAVKDASAQADAIASTLGVTITGVVSVTTSPAYLPTPVVSAVAGSSQTPIVAPQSLTISASVQAVYAIS
jgi:uncharacterized protein